MGHISFWLTLDVNLLGDNIDTIMKNTETVIDASKEVGLEINNEKTKYRILRTIRRTFFLKKIASKIQVRLILEINTKMSSV
jgi:hypothetical protein